MEISLSQYVINPMGRHNAVLSVSTREHLRNEYKKKYDAVMMREHGIMQHVFYKDLKNNVYVAHFKVPSQTINDFYYDVVFEFRTNSDVKEAGQNLFEYNCKFFSNDPSFVYTYAYVFKKENLIIDQLKSKLGKKANTTSADIRNPGNNVGYVKSIYFAYLYMKSRQYNVLDNFKAVAVVMSKRNLRSDVEDAETKIRQRQESGEKLKALKKKYEKRVENIMKHKPEEAKTMSGKINSMRGGVNTINKMKKITAKRSNSNFNKK